MENSVEASMHVFLVSLPAQGHINPLLRLGKRLASDGLLVTFCTTEKFGKKLSLVNGISETQIGRGYLRFEFFDDGSPEGFPNFSKLEIAGREALPLMIKKHQEQGRPVSCIIHNNLISWACEVAREINMPSAVLWTNACAVLSAYYHFQRKLVPFPTESERYLEVQLPSLPPLKYDEIPSFMHPSTPVTIINDAFLTQIKNLDKEVCVLLDTFHELEKDVIEQMSKFCNIKPVGPLFKIQEQEGKAIRGDCMKADNECIMWLDSKPALSVVYISFGSIANMRKEQIEEIAHGVLNSDLNFIWVFSGPQKSYESKLLDLPHGFLDKIGQKGKVVQWCNQEQVLAHSSIACFMSHCGWNSTIEAVASGVPVVAFPMFGDQVTDAKLLVDMFGIGVRVCGGVAMNRLVTKEQIERCLKEATMGEKANELKQNALKWKKVSEDAVGEGGSSRRNFEDFLHEIRKGCGADKSKYFL